MDINLLSKMIGELILDHDEVGLPGVGTFVAELVPASFSDRGYTINPPYRRLSFHCGSSPDNLLVDMYAKSNRLEQGVAEAIILKYTDSMKEVLKERKTIVFPGLGRLRATRQNNFFFVSDENIDIYPDGFGLSPVSLKSHLVETEEIESAISQLASMIRKPQEEVEIPVGEPELLIEPAEPEIVIEPVEEPVPVQETTPVEEAVPVEESAPVLEPVAEEPKRSSRWWIAPVTLVALAAVALAALAILGRVAPDIVDPFLYSPEELRIINY